VTTNGRVPTQQVEGTVEATNATGPKIGGAWINVSRFRPVQIPETGAYIRVDVDSKGYIRELEVLGPAVSNQPPAGRDDRIAKLAVLKAAAKPRRDVPVPRGRPVRARPQPRGQVASMGQPELVVFSWR